MESPVEGWGVPLPLALAAGFEAARAAFGTGSAHGPQQLPAPQEKRQVFQLPKTVRSLRNWPDPPLLLPLQESAAENFLSSS